MRLLLPLLFAASAVSGATAQATPEERGFPVINIYEQRVHHGGSQTFEIAQDPNGTLYFANLGGVLTYDGAWWRLIHLPNEDSAFSVKCDGRGRVMLGSVNEFGLLAPDTNGAMKYHSLSQQLPTALQEFGDVISIAVVADGFLIVTERHLFFWSGGVPLSIADIDPNNKPPLLAFPVGSDVWLSGDAGIQKVDLRTMHLLSPVPAFAGKRVDLVLPGDGNSMIVAVREEGLFRFAGGEATPFSPEMAQWLKGKRITSGCRLLDGRYVVTTRVDGLAVVTQAGEVEQIIDANAGLPDDLLDDALTDREGSLWLAFHGPIARIDLSSPVTIIDKRRGLKGSVSYVDRFDKALFVASTHGLFYFDPPQPGQVTAPQAHAVEGVKGSAWSLFPRGDEMIVGGGSGLYRVDATRTATKIPGSDKVMVYGTVPSQEDPNLMWVASRSGVGLLRKAAAGWHFDGFVPGSRQYVSTIVERNGVLWCGTVYDGVLRIEQPLAKEPKVTVFGEGEEISATTIAGRLVFVRATGTVVQINPKGEFVPDPELGEITEKGFFQLAEDAQGNIWINTTPPRMLRKLGPHRYAKDGEPLVQVDAADIQFMHVETDGDVWFGSDRGAFRYVPSMIPNALPQPRPMIRRVATSDGSLVIAASTGSVPHNVAPLRHAFGRLRIEFAPLSYRPGVLYQYQLDPIDANWSGWTSEPFIDYTNLPEGTYTFRLRSRGAGSRASDEVRWSFSVMPPWYRTPLMVVVWVLLGVLVVLAIVSIRTATLRRQAETLRERIAERTDELRETVHQLRDTKGQLEEKNDLLERANARLEQLSLVDDLTGVFNRRFFQKAISDEWHRAQRRKQPVALLLLDLDYFKELNDRSGHQAGDACLREIGQYMSVTLRRAGDVVARYGGEEFAVLLPAVSAAEAARVGEMLRAGIERVGAPYATGDARHVTTSCGVAALVPDGSNTMDMLIEFADRALYEAKRTGRNCVRIFDASLVQQ